MSFRISPTVRDSICREMLRIFDTGAEVRFWVGAQPVSVDEDPLTEWVASRLLETTTEAGTLAGQPVTFETKRFPTAEQYATAMLNAETFNPPLIALKATRPTAVTLITAKQGLVEAAQAALDAAVAAQFVTSGAKDAANLLLQEKRDIVTALSAEYTALVGTDYPAAQVTQSIATATKISAQARLTAATTAYNAAALTNDTFPRSATFLFLRNQAETNVNNYTASVAVQEIALATATTLYINTQAVLAEALSRAYDDPTRDTAVTSATSANNTAGSIYIACVNSLAADQIALSNSALDFSLYNPPYQAALLVDQAANTVRITPWQTAITSAQSALDAATTALTAANLALDIADAVLLMPIVVAKAAEIVTANGVVATQLTATNTAIATNTTAVNLVTTKTTLLAQSVTAATVAETALVGLDTLIDQKQTQYDAQISAAYSAAGGEGGKRLLPIPTTGWCRIVHPTYPGIYIDATFGGELDEADFTVEHSILHSSLDTLYPLSLTLATV